MIQAAKEIIEVLDITSESDAGYMAKVVGDAAEVFDDAYSSEVGKDGTAIS